jgi:peptidyl-prolyl cis-trans isomerase A (cyclophilin A)
MRKVFYVAIACLVLGGAWKMFLDTKKAAPAISTHQGPAPDVFMVKFDTSKGPVVVEVHRDWAPHGADHLYDLVKLHFYDGNRFFRVHRNFVVQFGINGDPATNNLWASGTLPDDPVKQSNTIGTLTYAAASGPNTRTTQLFFNLKDNSDSLDATGFAPIGKVITGLDIVESLYGGYGDMPSQGGHGPDPTLIQAQGNAYLDSHFPRLDYINKATIE